MSEQKKNLYKLQKKDILNASIVLTDAFQDDPFWEKRLEEANIFSSDKKNKTNKRKILCYQLTVVTLSK